MKEYFYSARDGAQNLQEGYIRCNQEQDVVDLLENRNWLPKKISPAVSTKWGKDDILSQLNELSTYLDCGIPVMQAYDLLEENSTSSKSKFMWRKAKKNAATGTPLWQTLSDLQNIDQAVCQMIEVGESTGRLPECLRETSSRLIVMREMKNNFFKKMIQPTITVALSITAVYIMVISLFPKIVEIAKMVGADLPPITLFIIENHHSIMRTFKLSFLGALALICALILCYLYTKRFRYFCDKKVFSLPVVGKIFKAYQSMMTSYSLSTTLLSGITIVNSYKLLAKSTGNRYVSEIYLRSKNNALNGLNTSEFCCSRIVFYPLFCSAYRSGEKSGRLSESLEEISPAFRKLFEQKVHEFTQFINFAIMFFIGFTLFAIAGLFVITYMSIL